MRDNSSGASVMRFVTAERQMCRDFAKDQLLGSANQVATPRCSNGKASPILSGTTGYASCLRYKDTGRHQKLVLLGHYADNANTWSQTDWPRGRMPRHPACNLLNSSSSVDAIATIPETTQMEASP
jgi:hypothetical protein